MLMQMAMRSPTKTPAPVAQEMRQARTAPALRAVMRTKLP
jgi:hypothetical protein